MNIHDDYEGSTTSEEMSAQSESDWEDDDEVENENDNNNNNEEAVEEEAVEEAEEEVEEVVEAQEGGVIFSLLLSDEEEEEEEEEEAPFEDIWKMIYFKVARTTITREFRICIKWTLTEFIQRMKFVCLMSLGMGNVKFIKTMQNTPVILDSEDAEEMCENDTITIENHFAEDLAAGTLSFYIKYMTEEEDILPGHLIINGHSLKYCHICFISDTASPFQHDETTCSRCRSEM